MQPPIAIAVAGVAGSGKTTLGRALARSLGSPLIDLDAVTNPLLESLPPTALGGHWLASPHHREIREGRYASLRAVARDVVGAGRGVVLVAPFTAELQGGPPLQALHKSLAGTDLRIIRLVGEEELFSYRRAARGAVRDRHRTEVTGGTPSVDPSLPLLEVDAELMPEQLLLRARLGLGLREPIDPAAALFDRRFAAVLCDLDGTLVDSTASVNRSWRRFSAEIGAPPGVVAQNHGRPATALIERLLPPERAAEGLARITRLEVQDAVRVTPAPGGRALWDAVPAAQRAVVTSGDTAIATARLRAAGFALPETMVTADDVQRFKPDPQPYLRAAARLGVDPHRCLVLEDATAGVGSARAAGCAVLAISGTVTAGELADADLVVDGLDRVTVEVADGGLRLRLRG